jgi:hypothetical protein
MKKISEHALIPAVRLFMTFTFSASFSEDGSRKGSKRSEIFFMSFMLKAFGTRAFHSDSFSTFPTCSGVPIKARRSPASSVSPGPGFVISRSARLIATIDAPDRDRI